MHTWADFGIDTRNKTSGEVKTTCPQCSQYRKKKNYPCLNCNLDKGLWHCWHCSWAGSLHKGEEHRSNPAASPLIFRKPVYRQTPLPLRVIEWFASRGIPEAILARRRISYGMVYMPQLEEEVSTIQFPYFRKGECVNVKYRDGHKHFRMVSGGERLFYGFDDIDGDTLIICEGEIDAMALEVAGFRSVVSVPDGAPSPTAKSYESKFDFLLSAEEVLKSLKKIILAVDNDAPGERLAEELARRLGPERCFRVTWSGGCKDANDVLVSHGVEVLQECITTAQPWPINGVITMDMLSTALHEMYRNGIQRGLFAGWRTLDKFYTVRPGEVTIVTGIPSHGKSTWVSALAVNLARLHDWQFTIFSPENYPLERYAATLSEQYIGKQFDGEWRMSFDEMKEAEAWLGQHFTFLMPEDEKPTVVKLLELARIQVYRQGIKGLILDPWNNMNHSRPPGQTETDYIAERLVDIRWFARRHGVHVWIVAHPTKLKKEVKGDYDGKYAPPTPYDINGSGNWRNIADHCLSVWRDIEANNNEVEIHVQKIKFREIGSMGMVELGYSPSCGRYHDLQEERQRWTA